MEQGVTSDTINSATQSEIANFGPNGRCRLRLRRYLLTNGARERRHVCAQLIKNQSACSARRQDPGGAHHCERAFRTKSIERIIQQLLLNAVAIERMQREWFAVFHLIALAWQFDFQPSPHKKFCGMRKKLY